MQTNWKNDGRSFEENINTVATHYQSLGLLRIRKVDPPTRVFKSYGQTRVVFLKNPFLDYAGTWTENGGQALFIEAKSTSVPKLCLGTSGLTETQIQTMTSWERYGAMTFVLWECKGRVAFIQLHQILQTIKERKHIKFEECELVSQGQGFLIYDFIENMRKALQTKGKKIV